MSYTGSVPDTQRRTDWRDSAECRTEDPELFFPKGYEGPSLLVIEQAKAVCRRCPVTSSCLSFALDEGIPSGIFGGLTEPERRSLQRSARRKGQSPEATLEQAAASPQRKSYSSLRELFEANTTRLIYGHLAWTGPARPSFESRAYTPMKVAYFVDRGRNPVGRVMATCRIRGCVLPAHLADDEERMVCGSRPGYQRHLKNRETPCDACRQANADADNRLRWTGTSKVAV